MDPEMKSTKLGSIFGSIKLPRKLCLSLIHIASMSLNVIDDILKIINTIHAKKKKKGTDNEIAYNLRRLQHQLHKIQKHPELFINKKPTIFENMKTIKRFSDLIEEMPDFELKNRYKNAQSGVFKTEVPGFAEKGSKR